MMIERFLRGPLTQRLGAFPAVALLGPRQAGKTTLARTLEEGWSRKVVYLDLERDSDRGRLAEPELYLKAQSSSLVILDEVQCMPDLFPLLRSLTDERIRGGDPAGHFLVLGSASPDLLRQSSESLAGRIAYLELAPFSYGELRKAYEFGRGEALSSDRRNDLWIRGGFPRSLLAPTASISRQWRESFVATYLERDLPQLGYRLPAERMRRLWSMLAYDQGAQLNLSRLAGSLGIDGKTVRHNLDLLTDLYMVRQLPAWSGNSTKRLIKAPKVYLRDSGLVHMLAGIPDLDTLLGHPLCGGSWEGFVIESLLATIPSSWRASYYRTRAQAEIDLVLEGPRPRDRYAIEIKRTLAPKASRGFRTGAEDVGAQKRYVVIPEGERFPLGDGAEAVPFDEVVVELEELWSRDR